MGGAPPFEAPLRSLSRGPLNLLIAPEFSGILATRCVPIWGRRRIVQLPAFNSAPRDSAGAGDSFLTCASMALCAGVDIWRSVYLGSLAAACQVSRVGNTPLTQQDLVAEIDAP